jgi:hypothetical protein
MANSEMPSGDRKLDDRDSRLLRNMDMVSISKPAEILLEFARGG